MTMVNLRELEKMVDEALAKETEESWNKWLEEEETKEIEPFLGLGMLSCLSEDYKFHPGILCEHINISYVFEEKDSNEPNNDYINAA